MTITRRDALFGLAAGIGAATPIAAFAASVASVSPVAPALAPAPSAPLSLSEYNTYYRKQPVWSDDIALADFMPLLHTHRWHFDGSTYEDPLISCVTNGRVFKVHRSQNYGTMVFEFDFLDMLKFSARDAWCDELAGAARYAAAWACKSSIYKWEKGWSAALVENHRDAVFIEFSIDDTVPPIVNDAPPLIIHDQLTPSRPWMDDEDEFADHEGDEFEGEELT